MPSPLLLLPSFPLLTSFDNLLFSCKLFSRFLLCLQLSSFFLLFLLFSSLLFQITNPRLGLFPVKKFLYLRAVFDCSHHFPLHDRPVIWFVLYLLRIVSFLLVLSFGFLHLGLWLIRGR